MPRAGHEGFEYVACAGRTVMALLAGILASPETWYVWAAFGVFGVATLVRAARNRRWMTGPAVVSAVVTTIKTASIRADDAGWPALEAWLNERMQLDVLERMMSDPLAELKDRMDGRYVQAKYRVVVGVYRPKGRGTNSP